MGRKVSGTNYAITRIYDIETDTWSTGANMPDIRSFMASAYNPLDQKIYLVGGYRTGQITSVQAQVWAYDPATNTFDASRAPIPHPVGGAGSGIIGTNQRLYVVGGRDASTVLSLNWEYDFGTNTWLQKAPAPVPTNVPGGGAYGGHMYLFGGGNPFASMPFETASTYFYDPVLNTWTVLGLMNVARSFPASTFVGGMALVAGGFSQYETTDVTETSGEIGTTSSSSSSSSIHHHPASASTYRHRRLHPSTASASASTAPPPPPPPPPGPACRVPRVIGLRLGQARQRIRRGNCSVGRVRRVRSRRALRGRVVSQSPRPGAARRQGFPVKLVAGRR